jgi:hypothetical protein
MRVRRSRALLTAPILAALVLAACGSDSEEGASTTTTGSGASPTTTAASGTAPVSLKGDCPDKVVIQLDWLPEAEHGFVYQLLGDQYTIDKGKARVSGPLVDQNGNDTGVTVEIRSGGAATGYSTPSELLYSDPDVLLGYVYTDTAIQNSKSLPSVAVYSGFNKNPQMIMWDPATYPDVTGIKDIGTKKIKVRYFGGAAWMDYFTGTGILSKSQVDGSYKGDPSLFVADEGKAAQQGFGSSEPYLYQHEIKGWMKPVEYQYINDLGWDNYAESLATRPENITKYAACLTKLVPLVQHASVDYLKDPAATNKIILDAAASFGGNFGWTYSQGAADYAATTMKRDGIVANGPDGVMGKFDMTRVSDLIKIAVPVYVAQDSPPKDGVTAEDIVTNQFLDPTIGL